MSKGQYHCVVSDRIYWRQTGVSTESKRWLSMLGKREKPTTDEVRAAQLNCVSGYFQKLNDGLVRNRFLKTEYF
jgi:hypothetical protein